MEKVHVCNGFRIVEREDGIFISWAEGLSGKTYCYEISRENMEKALKSEKDAYEVMIFAETGRMPLSEEERYENNKNFIRKHPKLLLTVPENQKMFDQEELKELLGKIK